MRLAGMLTVVALIGAGALIGCSLDGETGTWFGRGPSASASTASQPATEPPKQSEAAASTARTSDSEVAPLAERIQTYVGRFPEDDLDRKAARPQAAQPSTAPAVAAAPQPEPPIVTIPAIQPQPQVTPPPAPAPQPARAQVQPMAPQSVEVVASPAPLTPRTPEPLGGNSVPRVELSDVRPAANAPAPGVQPPPAANQPTQGTVPDAPAADNLLAMIQHLEQQVALQPQQLEDQFRLRLLYAATGDDEKATGSIAGANPIQSDLVAGVFRVLAAARQAVRNPTASAPAALAAVDELRRLVSQQTPVVVSRMAFVTRVNSFGDYDAVPARFVAGQPVHVFLYTEVGNFRSEPTEDNRLRTLLSEKVEIFDAEGKVIWQRSEPQIEDRVLTPRRDFFMTMEIRLPETTPPGEYVVKVTIEDKLGATTDQQRMTFSIAGK